MSADKQLKAYIDRVLRLKEEQDTIGDDIREVYAEAKGEGYDKTVMGKLVAHLRKVAKSGEDAVSEQADIFDTYLTAYHRASGTPVATHTHEENYDWETGEVLDTNPRLIKQVVDGMQTEAGRAALISAVDIMIEREETEEPASHGEKAVRPTSAGHVGEESPAANPVANVEEEATGAIAAASNDPASRTDDVRERQHASTVGFADDCRTGGNEQMAAAAAPVGDAGAYAEGIPVAISTASDQPPTGGSHVDDQGNAATHQAGFSSSKAPAFVLRPNCLTPNDCAGYGSRHCHVCTKAIGGQAA